MAKVIVTRAIPGPAMQQLVERHDVSVWPGELAPAAEQLRELVASADGLLCTSADRIDEQLLDAAPRLRAIATYAVGSDNIDLAAAAARAIPVGVTPDVLTDATADIAIGLLLSVARRLREAEAAVRAGKWGPWTPQAWLGADLNGARLLIVGAGRIGRATARRAQAFGMEIAFAGRDDDLPSLLADADVVSLHTPLTPATERMIDRAALAAMKRGAILINTGRGRLVDQEGLREALVSGQLGGAGLDVTDPEPLPADAPLLQAPNLVVLPHIGSATHATREGMTRLAVANLLAALDGQPMPHPAPAPVSASHA
ncbi:D-glycerate dehydrogenase [Conexibacter sp. CPCC 206217]|uniref:2-hydroxyacid dehydrogenase n=1 Tax=Conexibacter sp. CPCC 206217 TaxID=3064574 RepID=UPI0027279E90|nr:D-glycerate dehydrogenase [Conexibacter sp. CPCC 206217]MDO8213164.1 D-glycerate dehydrogenase [Conexibacter sp. CPCC 206217]